MTVELNVLIQINKIQMFVLILLILLDITNILSTFPLKLKHSISLLKLLKKLNYSISCVTL